MPPQATSVKIGNVTVALRRAGSTGPKILYLHGADGLTQWLPFFDALADGYELLVPEHPGFGASDDPAFIRSVPDLAMFYLDFLEALDLGAVHLIGHSLGGWIAAEMLIRDRAPAKSLTLIAPAGLRVSGVLSGDFFIWSREEVVRNVFYDQAYAERLLSLPLSDEQVDTMLKNRFTATKLGWQPRWFDPDLEKWLHRVKLPALVVWGEDDKIMPSAYATAWQERLPDARLLKVPQCGHVPHVEKLDAVIGPLRDFLAGATR